MIRTGGGMEDDFIFDEDRLTGRRLTDEEIQRFRAEVKKDMAFARKYFRDNPPRGCDCG